MRAEKKKGDVFRRSRGRTNGAMQGKDGGWNTECEAQLGIVNK